MIVDYLPQLAPLVVLSLAVVVLMLAQIQRAELRVMTALTIAFLGVALISLNVVARRQSPAVGALFVFDDYALYFAFLALAAALAVVVFSFSYLARIGGGSGAWFILLVTSTIGAIGLAGATHFASLFLSLELLTISLYALVAYRFERSRSLEAGLKYLILAGASTAFMLFGMACVYAEGGSMVLKESMRAFTVPGAGGLTVFGLMLITVGIGFKLSLVPFQMWAPDVYEASPAPVTAFIATVSKAAVVAVLLRYLGTGAIAMVQPLFIGYALLAIASIILGNLLALRQQNVKRMLAYSSVSHMGYLMLGVMVSGSVGMMAAIYYITFYVVATLGAFGVISALSSPLRDADGVQDFRGLYWQRPWLTAVMTLMLLSLAGLPLTAGFFAKFLLVFAAAGYGFSLVGVLLAWLVVLSLVIGSVVGLYYYFGLMKQMFSRGQPGEQLRLELRESPLSWLTLAVLSVLTLLGGVFPAPFIDFFLALVRGL